MINKVKKYLVIGNPIEHSLSPKLHNHWFNKNNIDAVYEKKQINEDGIKEIINEVRNGKIDGINVTVPFKKSVIPFIDELSSEAKEAWSVNTIYKENNKVLGHNTDISGFELAIRGKGYNIKDKKVFILGAGGVVASIIIALRKMEAAKIILSNRTRKKAEELKKTFSNLEVVEWGETPEFNMIINATSLGLNKDDEIKLNYADLGPNKLFYDIIYNPQQTKFLSKAKQFGNQTENGKMMFIYQAHQAFTIWHKVMPKIDEETIKLLDL
jgi:shikimate dehydrogenase